MPTVTTGSALLPLRPARLCWPPQHPSGLSGVGRRDHGRIPNPAAWEEALRQAQAQLQDRARRTGYASVFKTRSAAPVCPGGMPDFQPRTADQTFEGTVTSTATKRRCRAALIRFAGTPRTMRSYWLHRMGLPSLAISVSFDTQPFWGFCDIDLYREHCSPFEIPTSSAGSRHGRRAARRTWPYSSIL